MDAIQTIYVYAQLAIELDDEINRQKEMSRVLDKLREAKTVAREVVAEVEALADDLIGKRSMKQEAREAFAPHLALLRETNDGLDELRNEIREFSNSPPLDSSLTASDGQSTDRPTKP